LKDSAFGKPTTKLPTKPARVSVTKARNDTRPESFTPNLDTLKIGEKLSSADNWRERRKIVRPLMKLMKPSLCAIDRERESGMLRNWSAMGWEANQRDPQRDF
jgi:hypothetical protein